MCSISWTYWVPQNGITPLHVSEENGYKEVVEILLGNGAEVNAPTKVISDEYRELI